MKKLLLISSLFVAFACTSSNDVKITGKYSAKYKLNEKEMTDEQKFAASFLAMANMEFDFKNDGSVIYNANVAGMSNSENYKWHSKHDTLFIEKADGIDTFKVEKTSKGYLFKTGEATLELITKP